MRNLRVLELRRRPHPTLGPSVGESDFGYFRLKNGMRVLASSGMGWDHVSCSFPNRTPTWDEMKEARDLFFGDEETVVQIHPPKSKYINCFPHCLHLWRKHDFKMPLPPAETIGPESVRP